MSEAYTPDTLFPMGQIRLAELTVYNWGSFDNVTTTPVSRNGLLITGDSGAGKSTLVDAWTALMNPAGRAHYNSAAASESGQKDRTLLTYMRGAFGSERDGTSSKSKNKRNDDVVTGVRGLHRSDDGAEITLCVLFWVKANTGAISDVHRLYFIARRNVALQEVLSYFRKDGAAGVKSWLRQDSGIEFFDNNFRNYQEYYRKLFSMENKKAPALLSRALGLKEVTNLTNLVREFVLEPSDVRDKARNALEGFANLKALHDELVDTRARHHHLSRLPPIKEAIEAATQNMAHLYEELEHLPAYFGELGAISWQLRLNTLEKQMEQLQSHLSHVRDEIELSEDRIERLNREYIESGGDRLTALGVEKDNAKREFNRVTQNASEYQRLAKQLDMDDRLDERVFQQNKAKAKELLESIEDQRRKSEMDFADARGEQKSIEDNLQDVNTQILEIEANPDSNIPPDYQRLRNAIVESVRGDRDEYLFFGELAAVQPEHREWQGAIERALGMNRLTLIVPENTYAQVNKWVNDHHTGMNVRLHVASDLAGLSRKQPRFKDNGFLRKLEWRDHAYRELAKHHFAKFDLECVDSTGDMNRTPFSMTKQGMIQKEHHRFEKKDAYRIDDRSRWALGFSNKARLNDLISERDELVSQVSKATSSLEARRLEMSQIIAREAGWNSLQRLSWNEINVTYYQSSYNAIFQEYEALRAEGSDLDKARRNLDDAKLAKKKLDEERRALDQQSGQVEGRIDEASNAMAECREKAKLGITDDVRTRLHHRVGEVNLEELAHSEGEKSKEILNAIQSTNESKTAQEKSANTIITQFRSNERWEPLAAEWGTDSNSIIDYIGHYRELDEEGLPKLVDKFRKRMNDETTNALASVKHRMDAEIAETKDRIEMINDVMARTEFSPGTILQLRCWAEKFPHVDAFDKKMRRVLSESFGDGDEELYTRLADLMTDLEEYCKDSLHCSRVLDSRYRHRFDAEVVDKKTRDVIDYMDSSSGKSGGERESFAGVIIAASLAYVLTPDGSSKPIYCTVFLDEAFSKTAETLGSRVLNVFKELHLHANMITPYKSINMLSKAVDSIIICERNKDTHSTKLIQTNWERLETDRKTLRAQIKQRREAENLIHTEHLNGVE